MNKCKECGADRPENTTADNDFIGMGTPQRMRIIATRGGKTAQEMGKAHKWTHDSAKLAGRLGGLKKKLCVK